MYLHEFKFSKYLLPVKLLLLTHCVLGKSSSFINFFTNLDIAEGYPWMGNTHADNKCHTGGKNTAHNLKLQKCLHGF